MAQNDWTKGSVVVEVLITVNIGERGPFGPRPDDRRIHATERRIYPAWDDGVGAPKCGGRFRVAFWGHEAAELVSRLPVHISPFIVETTSWYVPSLAAMASTA